MTAAAAALIAVAVLLADPAAVAAQTLELHGQVSSWFIVNDQEPSTPGIGLRYLPTLTVEKPLTADRSLGGELSLNAYASAQAPAWQDVQTTARVKPYRLWARYKTSRFET